MIKKGDSETFYEQLKKLNEEVKKEWISKGNNDKEFKEIGPKIIIILDNASFHKKKEISNSHFGKNRTYEFSFTKELHC